MSAEDRAVCDDCGGPADMGTRPEAYTEAGRAFVKGGALQATHACIACALAFVERTAAALEHYETVQDCAAERTRRLVS